MIIKTSAGEDIIDVVVNDDSDRQHALMGHDMLTLRFSLAESVDFPSRCYCTFGGRKYIMFNNPECTKKHSRRYDYVLTMYTYEYWLSIIVMRDLRISYAPYYSNWTFDGGIKTKFPLTATPREHLQYIADCLNKAEKANVWRVDYSRTLGMVQDNAGSHYNYNGVRYKDDGDMTLVNYDSQYCIDAIKAIAEAFNTEFEVEDNGIYHLICLHMVEYHKSAPLNLEYGKGNGFESGIARRNQTEVPPLDRLYVQGGEQNIPEHYGQTQSGSSWTGTKESTLMLPKPSTADNISGVRNIRYDGETLYFETREYKNISGEGGSWSSWYTYYWFDNKKKYMYGKPSQNGSPAYMIADAELGGETIPATFPEPFDVANANTWAKRYEIDEDRRSIYRANPSSRTPLRNTNVEGFYDGSEVYPMRVGTVSAVREVNNDGTAYTSGEKYYDIFDGDTDTLGTTASGKLDYADCGIGGETMTVIFQDGMLAGREFNIQTVSDGTNVKPNCGLDTSTTPTSYRIPLCQSEQDGFVMPTDPFVPRGYDSTTGYQGDHYIVFHCQLPDQYVTDAENRMLWQAVDYMFHNDEYTYSFSGSVDEIFAQNMWSTVISPATATVGAYMAIGQYINVIDDDLFGSNGQTMRVTNIKQKVNNRYDIDLSLTNAPQKVFDWAKKLSATVREVTVRPMRWRPSNHILPPQMRGMRNSIPILNVIDTTDTRPSLLEPASRGGGSRRNTIMPVVDRLAERTNDNDTLRSDLSEAIFYFNAAVGAFNTSINTFNSAVDGLHSAEGDDLPKIEGSIDTINWSDCINLTPSKSTPTCKSMPEIKPIK